MGIVYRVTNQINGKVYIGKTTKNLATRKRKHYEAVKYCHTQWHFHCALRKYPEDVFVWEVIAEAESNEELNALEIGYIKEYASYDPTKGYNSTFGGDGAPHTEEGKRKIGLANKGRVWTAEMRQHLSEKLKQNPSRYWLGKKRSPETIAKIAESKRGKPSPKRGIKLSQEIIDKIRATKAANPICGERHHMYGKHHTEEAKARMSASKKGTPAPNKGVPMSEEQKQKLSAAKRGKSIRRKSDSYSNRCSLCDTEFKSATNSSAFCQKCKDYFSRAWCIKLRKMRAEGIPIDSYLAKRDNCDTLPGEGPCIIVCKVCGMNFRALTGSYRFCPTCKEARDGD